MILCIDDYIAAKSRAIESCLESLVEKGTTPYQSLIDAARYSLLGSGKRLRPILAVASAEAMGCAIDRVLPAACALEMVHTYSLIHDDLPCMDNDDLRRGKPTVHKAYSEAHAVLAGDFLLTKAFEVISTAASLSDAVKVKLITILAQKAGAEGMIGGQVMDMESESKKLDELSLRRVHALKTGAMISASIEFGAVIAEADEEMRKRLRSFGEHLGLAFQIVDDVLDVTSTEACLGKPIYSDITNDKSTYVSILGVEQAKSAAWDHYQQAMHALDGLTDDFDVLRQLAALVINRNK